MIGEGLSYVSVVVEEPSKTANFFSNCFDLPATTAKFPENDDELSIVMVGRVALVLAPPAHPFTENTTEKGVHHIAFAASDPETAVNDAVLAGLVGGESTVGAGLNGGRRIALPRTATAGVRTWFAEPLELSPASSPWVERIDHLGIASTNNALGRAAFVDVLGCGYESEQVDAEFRQAMETFTSDKYGIVERSGSAELVGALRVTFVTVGDCELEFLQDETPTGKVDRDGGALTTKQDKSAIARFVERRGDGLHHVALKTPDANATLGRLAENGADMLDLVGRPGSRRAQIGFIHPRSFGGLLIHLVERSEI